MAVKVWNAQLRPGRMFVCVFTDYHYCIMDLVPIKFSDEEYGKTLRDEELNK